MNITKQDIIKTVIIVWFMATTGYVIFDQYNTYKVRGIQAAYQQAYADSVDQLIAQTQKNQCTPFEVHNGEKKITVVSGECVAQQQPQQAPQQSSIVPKGK